MKKIDDYKLGKDITMKLEYTELNYIINYKDKCVKEALKKQAEDIIDLAFGFECCPYCGNYKDIQNHHCSKCKKRIVMPDDAYWFSFYLKQLGKRH